MNNMNTAYLFEINLPAAMASTDEQETSVSGKSYVEECVETKASFSTNHHSMESV